jgi:hypothetical protein
MARFVSHKRPSSETIILFLARRIAERSVMEGPHVPKDRRIALPESVYLNFAVGQMSDAEIRELASPVGGPHSLRGVGRGDGGGRGQWRREKNAQVPPVVEAKRGGGRGGSGVDSSPRPAVAPIGASTRHAKTPFKPPPPPILFLAAQLFEINIQMPWSAAPAPAV